MKKLLLLSCLLFNIGCYTQLSIFNPDAESDDFYSYSAAPLRPNLTIYAQSGPAYSMLYNRFQPFFGYNNMNRDYYSYYYQNFYYTDRTNTLRLTPIPTNRTPRSFSTDRTNNTSYNTNLNITRTSSSSGSSKSSTQTKSARSARVTRRN
jgi:hypothetical protein